VLRTIFRFTGTGIKDGAVEAGRAGLASDLRDDIAGFSGGQPAGKALVEKDVDFGLKTIQAILRACAA